MRHGSRSFLLPGVVHKRRSVGDGEEESRKHRENAKARHEKPAWEILGVTKSVNDLVTAVC